MKNLNRHIAKTAIRATNSVLNFFVLVVIVLLLGFASYGLWDSEQLYANASVSNYTAYKPTEANTGLSFKELQDINPEVFAWLTVYGTHIDYPVTQAEDNMKYVNTNAENHFSASGAIFLDCDNNRDFSDFASIIYGHHMERQAMFGEIGSFQNQEVFEAHRYGNLYYNGQDHGLEFFAFLHIDAYDSRFFNTRVSADNRQTYLDDIFANALHQRDIALSPDDHLVLLTTCSPTTTNGRDVLVGRISNTVFADSFLESHQGNGNGYVSTAHSGNIFGLLPLWAWLPILSIIVLILLALLLRNKKSAQDSDEVSEDVSDDVSDNVSGKTSDRASGRTSGKTSGKLKVQSAKPARRIRRSAPKTARSRRAKANRNRKLGLRILSMTIVLFYVTVMLPTTSLGEEFVPEVSISAEANETEQHETVTEEVDSVEDVDFSEDEAVLAEDVELDEEAVLADDAIFALEAEEEEPEEPTETDSTTIDLSARSDSVVGPGYTITGGPAYPFDQHYLEVDPRGVLVFNAAANGNTYNIIQTGIPNDLIASSIGVKYGSSMVGTIEVQNGVNITLIISEIDYIGSISILGTGRLTLILDGQSRIWGNIHVPAGSQFTLASLSGGDGDILNMPSDSAAVSYNARIGSSGNNSSMLDNTAGQITINSGIVNMTVHSMGAGIGGGGGGVNAAAGSGGNITINGGRIQIYQYGVGSYDGTGFSGAGIGGGGGSEANHNGAGAGNVLITGGTVIVRQYTRAAGIGGGSYGPAGNIEIRGGYVDVEVIRAAEKPYAGDGTAIGNSSGTNAGTGTITISGGTVRAVAINTAIGRMQGGSIGNHLNIYITGGSIYARGTSGPGIGYVSESYGSTLSITGGTVVAESIKVSAIGGFSDAPAFILGAAADVWAISGGTRPAFNVADNQGDGYYVNASLETKISSSNATDLLVYSAGVYQRTLSLPAGYQNFGYSSNQASQRTDTIIAQYGTTVLGTIVRTYDNSSQIYSIKTNAGYSSHSKVAGVLTVKLGSTSGMQLTVTEQYVDIDGNPMPDMPPTTTTMAFGALYTKEIPEVDDYIAVGHRWDTTNDDSYIVGNPELQVYFSATIYFVYMLDDRLHVPPPVGLDSGNTAIGFALLASIFLLAALTLPRTLTRSRV